DVAARCFCDPQPLIYFTADKSGDCNDISFIAFPESEEICNLTDDNEHFCNKQMFSLMKNTAFFINCSRGPLVNEHDLAEALNAGQLAGAAVDVVSTEPIKGDNPLLNAKNCYVTPHIAWATLDARKRITQTTAENIQAFIGGSPIHVVNP
ncbi:MAG: NAD(P)-dependent oxidoreductase, partial [Phycisphaeraceae bacterium]|nr:NAD(P)-dependent oxidoreductase [Phycisphaeraceae bacterium]